MTLSSEPAGHGGDCHGHTHTIHSRMDRMCDSRIFRSYTPDTPSLVDTDTSHHGALANLDAAAL